MKSAILFMAMALLFNSVVYAQNWWICTCFKPDYDRGCCNEVNGTMMVDGNVCDIPRARREDAEKFKTCCTGINGRYKCK